MKEDEVFIKEIGFVQISKTQYGFRNTISIKKVENIDKVVNILHTLKFDINRVYTNIELTLPMQWSVIVNPSNIFTASKAVFFDKDGYIRGFLTLDDNLEFISRYTYMRTSQYTDAGEHVVGYVIDSKNNTTVDAITTRMVINHYDCTNVGSELTSKYIEYFMDEKYPEWQHLMAHWN